MEKQLESYDVSRARFERPDPGPRASPDPVSAPVHSGGLVARLLAHLERVLERPRQGALPRTMQPATVDHNWAGQWFADTWQSHDSIFPPKPRDGTKHWDDRLD